MDVFDLDDYVAGWFLGNFTPAIDQYSDFEVCLKRYARGELESRHYQQIAVEYTLIVSGKARMGDVTVGPNSIVRIAPGEAIDFEALDDVVLVAVKTPSLPNDKIVGDNA